MTFRAPPSHGVRSASLAAVVAAAVEPELGLAVASARHCHRREPSLLGRLRSAPMVVALRPPCVFSPYRISQCRTVALLRPTASAISAIDMPASTSGLELLPRDASPRRVLVAVRRLQPVFLDPVADGRFMPAEAPCRSPPATAPVPEAAPKKRDPCTAFSHEHMFAVCVFCAEFCDFLRRQERRTQPRPHRRAAPTRPAEALPLPIPRLLEHLSVGAVELAL